MDTYVLITLLQTLTFLGYITFLWKKFDYILPSISESWYQLRPHNQHHLFSWFICFLGLFTLMQGGILFLVSGVSLMYVGIATEFKNTHTIEDEIHFLGGGLGILFSLLGLWSWGLIWPTLCMVLILCGIYVWDIQNKTWWLEIGAFLSIISGMWWRALGYASII